MATTAKPRVDKAPEVFRKTKVETTYEYVPILGEVLGWWRKVDSYRVGETVEIHLNHSIGAFDRILLNGKDITPPAEEVI